VFFTEAEAAALAAALARKAFTVAAEGLLEPAVADLEVGEPAFDCRVGAPAFGDAAGAGAVVAAASGLSADADAVLVVGFAAAGPAAEAGPTQPRSATAALVSSAVSAAAPVLLRCRRWRRPSSDS
jgi:hypothetical protein